MVRSDFDNAAQLEREFGRILEDSLNEIFIFDATTLKFLQVNKGGRANLGYSMEELHEMTPIDIKPEFTSESFEMQVKPLRDGLKEAICFETIHQRKDGSTYSVEVHLQLASFHEVPAFIAIILDTTARIRSANELRVRNRAIESVGVGIVITDARQHDMPIIFCNQAFEKITGYSASEVVGRNCRFLQDNDRNQDARHVIRDAVKTCVECNVLIRNYRKDGTMYWNELTVSPVFDDDGQLTHFVGLTNDVTERILASDEKLEREARLAAILNTAVEAIITIDERGCCESINAAAQSMFGYDPEEVIGNNISMLMPAPFREEHDQYLSNYLKTGVKKIIGIGREAVGLRKDGTEFPIHLSVSEVRIKDRRLFTGFIQDITDRKEAERRLVQSERLAALGEAMATLAHEGRNSLQRIQIAVETARMSSEANEKLASQLDVIEKAGDGLDALLEELRNYAAPMHLEKSTCSIVGIWRDAWSAAALQCSVNQAQLIEHVCDERLMSEADPFRLGQMFRNLFENSLAACGDNLRMEIDVSASHKTEKKSWSITLRDNGPGLSEEQRTRIFEPFFTTKPKGTGLGMAIAQRIAEAHEGSISAGNADGGGAEFVIILPQ